jgi:DNA (cytosine-5)-methyltransferase 1
MAAYLGIPLEEALRVGATPDGPRYKAIGNSMAVPVMRWIGERIQLVDGIRG